jgi:hypothetical protein
VVACYSEDEARCTHPNGSTYPNVSHLAGNYDDEWTTDINNVTVKHIGTAAPDIRYGVLMSSYKG